MEPKLNKYLWRSFITYSTFQVTAPGIRLSVTWTPSVSEEALILYVNVTLVTEGMERAVFVSNIMSYGKAFSTQKNK